MERTLAALVLTMLMAGCEAAAGSPPAPPVSPDPPTTDQSSPAPYTETDLSVVDPSTGDAVHAFALEGHQLNGERSPDGTRLVFTGGRIADGPFQIYVVDAEGSSEPRRLTGLKGGAGDPTWSPDGRWIAFVSPVDEPRSDIYVMRSNGSDVRKLAGTPKRDLAPDWSPDGERVVFHTGYGAEGWAGIWIATFPSGSLAHITTNGEGDGDSSPAWSPDGTWITFIRYEDAPGSNLEEDDSDLWLMHPDGKGQHRLLDEEGPLQLPVDLSSGDSPMFAGDSHYQGAPTWSPDGRFVAYSGGHCDCIAIINIRTGEFARTLNGDHADISWDAEGILVAEGMAVK